jgi:hypothetical protein
MVNSNPYFYANRWLRLDHILGLRAWGLIIYGTLPASLFALGVIKVTVFEIRQEGFLLPFLLIALFPILVLFLLLRERLIAWYLLRDGLYTRTTIITLVILILSTVISLAAGHVTGRYVVIPWGDWIALDPQIRWFPILESLLIAIAALVGSSTLFITAIKEESGLPGLPSKEFVQKISALRTALINIQADSIWSTRREDLRQLCKTIYDAQEVCLGLSRQTSLAPQHIKFCSELANDLKALVSALEQVESTSAKWSDYFAPSIPSGLNQKDQALRKAVWKLTIVKVNG